MQTQEKKVSDLVLIKQFKKGSVEAFEEIVSRYEAQLYNLAMRFVKNPEDAEEVLQDVFTTLYRKAESFQGKSAFSSWMYRITVNAAFMKLRKRKQTPTAYLEDMAPATKEQCLEYDGTYGERSDNSSMNRELKEIIQIAINKLPEQYRAVFILRDVDGMSNQEVGEILELSIPAVKSRLHRSRLMLRRKLQKYWNETQNDNLPVSNVMNS
jgi:RNA polymerase sigma-70 factor (ECF subfamily)